jgi:hypothetical protein
LYVARSERERAAAMAADAGAARKPRLLLAKEAHGDREAIEIVASALAGRRPALRAGREPVRLIRCVGYEREGGMSGVPESKEIAETRVGRG